MAAVSIVHSDHSLEARIYGLRNRDLTDDARQVLEEAVRLKEEGLHIEAVALIDRVEAMNSPVSGETSAQPGGHAGSGEDSSAKPAQSFAGRLVADISSGLTKVLVQAIQDLEFHLTDEARRSTSALGDRLDKIQAAVESYEAISQRMDGLAQAGAAVEANCEQLAATAACLQEADLRHDAEIHALRLEVQSVSDVTRDRIEEICRRLEDQDRQISTANSSTSDLTAKLKAAAERLERHAGAIQTLHQDHHQRAAALDQVAEVLGRLRAPGEVSQTLDAL
jgi:hypothetical protein